MAHRDIRIRGSNKTQAQLSSEGEFYRGEWQDIIVTGLDPEENVPLNIRQSLIGLVIPTVFTAQILREQGVELSIPEESRLAYSNDIIGIFHRSDKAQEARALKELCPSRFDMYVFPKTIYNLI
jgi:hypothetical protein